MDPNELAERGVLARIFLQYPNSFVWVGGSVLRLIFHSPRSSYDLDLTPIGDLTSTTELAAAISDALREFNGLEGGAFHLAETESGAGFVRFRINAAGKAAFTVDLVRMGGQAASGTRTVLMASPLGPATVVIPKDSSLLAGKLRTFLLRTYPKPGDLFDIWFLHDRGIRLSKSERQALADSLAFAEIDLEAASSILKKFDNPAWIAALERAGVKGLTKASAAQLVATVRRVLEEVLA
jgi:hypothetical protein